MGTKPWWQSKGVWGGLVAAFAGVAGMAGLNLTSEDVSGITDLMVEATAVVGGALAIYGRITARTSVSAK